MFSAARATEPRPSLYESCTTVAKATCTCTYLLHNIGMNLQLYLYRHCEPLRTNMVIEILHSLYEYLVLSDYLYKQCIIKKRTPLPITVQTTTGTAGSVSYS
jgi:hypothetical protein